MGNPKVEGLLPVPTEEMFKSCSFHSLVIRSAADFFGLQNAGSVIVSVLADLGRLVW